MISSSHTVEFGRTHVVDDSLECNQHFGVINAVVLIQLLNGQVLLESFHFRGRVERGLFVGLVYQKERCNDNYRHYDEPLSHNSPIYKYRRAMEILEKNQYQTDDPYVREIIAEEINREVMTNINQSEQDQTSKKKGKSAHEQNLINLRNNDSKFKYIWGENDELENFDYQDEERRKRDREMELVEAPRFKIIGNCPDKASKLRRKPILRMTDVYIPYNSRIRRVVNRIFQGEIAGGKKEVRKEENNVIIAKTASNAHELQEILKNYQNHEEDGFGNEQLQLNEQQLQEYIIQRNQSKQNYFLFYRNELPKKTPTNVVNNPLMSDQFLTRLHRDVQRLEKRYDPAPEIDSDEDPVPPTRDEEKPVKEYFGQFIRPGRSKSGKWRVEDNFQERLKANDNLCQQVLDYYSYVDNDIVDRKYLKPLQENDQLQLNLSNPLFFQPKLHAILYKDKQSMHDNEYRAKLAEANKNNPKVGEKSLASGEHGLGGRSKLMSALDSDHHDFHHEGAEQEHMTIQKVIETQIKNVNKEPLKHSQLATKFQFVKFTLEEDCFNYYHRNVFPFHEHLSSGRVKIELMPFKSRKVRPNGLVINAEMKESNEKFSRKEDLSLANSSKGEFIMIEYIEETPLLMSDVGMCQRMFIQVNYLEILERIKKDIINNKSFEEMEEDRDKRRGIQNLKFDKHCELWRKTIREVFGENGKQFFWEPKNNGKLIGIPEGPGVTLMESNLCTVPIVKKKPSSREFLLVREGKRWVIRRIDNLYVSGQVEPHKKVFCPGSRQHTEFKLAYEKAYIVKQIKEYGSVNFDQLKLTFKFETENSLRKALKNSNTISKDSKNYRLASEQIKFSENDLTPEDVCLYERMQKSLCELKEAGISDIRSNQKMKNVLKEFNRKHFLSHEKIAIARMIREQLQLTSWYLTDSFLKYKQKASKIEINGFADPTNGKGGYSYINKPQKERTSKEDMEEKIEKQKTSTVSDLRKLNCQSSRELLRNMGHNEDEIDIKSRWQLINVLKNKEGTEFSRRERETKYKKIENEKKEISKNFNRLLSYLNDLTEEPAYDYGRQKRNRLEHYMIRERDYWEKIKRKYGKPAELGMVKEEARSDDSDEDD